MNSVDDSHVDNSELRLVESAAGGDREAQRELFEQHRDVAFAAAVRIVGNHHDALDVVQDAFIKAFARLSGFRRGASFRTWLLRIVTNQALDLLRSRKVRLAMSLDAGDEDDRPITMADGRMPPVGQKLEQQEVADRLSNALESLPAEQRAVFALYATGELTYGEIAEALGIPIGTVMSRLYHARRRLHELLADLAPADAKERTQ